MKRLQDKVAIITGGAQGIGRATAERFIAEGARVAIWDINAEQGALTVEALIKEAERLAEGQEKGAKWNGGEGGTAIAASSLVKFYKVNTTDLEAVEAAMKQVVEDFGQVNILVNNAGITRDATLKKMTAEQWQQVIDVNLTGVFNCTKAAYPYMAENGFGRILNAASVVAHYGNFGQSNYVATKAGLIGMTKVWAREFGRKGITVNAVAPGFIATEMVSSIPEKVISMIEEKTPVTRLGKPEEIANAYLFLASDEAAFVTGAVLNVDGGLTL
jgi:3-oxoacyl-[acyl-carrier protein] reductase